MFKIFPSITAKGARKLISSGFLALGLLYCFVNISLPHSVCDSFGCRAVQSGFLWYVGLFYCLSLLLIQNSKREKLFKLFWPVLVSAGVAVECGLVLYQALLGLYCIACLGFASIFVLFLITVPDLPSRVRTGVFAGGYILTAVIVFVSLALANMHPAPAGASALSGKSAVKLGVLSSTHGTAIVFEPQCPHCHKLIKILKKDHLTHGITFCPQAWSMRSVAKLAKERCRGNWSAACVVQTLVLVRANNRYCSHRGITEVPALVEPGGKILKGGEQILAYLMARDQALHFGSSQPEKWNDSWGAGVAGACTAGASCD